VTTTLAARGLVTRARLRHDRRAVLLRITAAGAELVEALFPAHTQRVSRTFAALDDSEKRSLAELCRKLAA
jgi:DNA-binding MarR family transcriptional regulator